MGGDPVYMESQMKDKSTNGYGVTQIILFQKRVKNGACLFSKLGTMSSRRRMGEFEG